jgi:hypothetical protein
MCIPQHVSMLGHLLRGVEVFTSQMIPQIRWQAAQKHDQ